MKSLTQRGVRQKTGGSEMIEHHIIVQNQEAFL